MCRGLRGWDRRGVELCAVKERSRTRVLRIVMLARADRASVAVVAGAEDESALLVGRRENATSEIR